MDKNKKSLVAIILGIVAVVGSLVAIISIQSGGTYAAGTYTITFRGAEGYELCGGLTCTTGPDGKVANCTGSYAGICNSWSTTPCNVGASGVCSSGSSGQSLAITSNNVASHVYTSNVTYYCLAGSSIANKNCNGPRPSSSISSSSSTPSSSTPSSSTPSSSVPENPSTGVTAIYMVWIIGLGALIYSIAYFRKINVK